MKILATNKTGFIERASENNKSSSSKKKRIELINELASVAKITQSKLTTRTIYGEVYDPLRNVYIELTIEKKLYPIRSSPLGFIVHR
ncbi:hypothetical protein ACNO7T_17130 [Vibrio campbellii]